MAAVWPGRDIDSLQPTAKGWTVKMRTRMPSPCNRKLWHSSTHENLQRASNEARNNLNHSVRRHIDGCKKCQENKVPRP